MTAWYALYTKPRQEALVAQQLQKRGLQTFLPQYCDRRWGKPPQVRPLFPGYLFVCTDLRTLGLSLLQWTPGLRRVVSFDGIPARIPDAAIALVKKRLTEMEAEGGFARARFRPGQHVRLNSGPLAGLDAVFEGPLKPADRVHILIRFLGEANRAVVPVDILEGVTPHQRPPRRTRGRGRRIKR